MLSPYFSVIIPALNEEKYLPVILKALSRQTYRSFEVILVDGQSDDNTIAVFNKFAENFPGHQLYKAAKRNVAYQRNIGGFKADGQFLVFFDADVNISDTFMEELHLASIKKKFKFATTWIDSDTENSLDKVFILLGNLGYELYNVVGKPFAGGYNTVIAKDVFRKLKGFREDQKINEDQDLAMRAFKKKIDVVILPQPRVTFSFRRFRSEGRLTVLRKYAKAVLYYHLRGPITRELFEYKMGGHAHAKKRKKYDLTKVETYLKSIERLEKKIVKILN